MRKPLIVLGIILGIYAASHSYHTQPKDSISIKIYTPLPVRAPLLAPNLTSAHLSFNSFAYGNCTQLVADRFPIDFSGNANQWIDGARANGYETGTEPRVGSVMVDTRGYYGHVAYVTAVNGTMITVEEMNVYGLNVIDTRTFDGSGYQYIYR